jgi:hypothetical protein
VVQVISSQGSGTASRYPTALVEPCNYYLSSEDAHDHQTSG